MKKTMKTHLNRMRINKENNKVWINKKNNKV